MHGRSVVLSLLGSLAVACAARAAPVLMISIDGLRPADVLEADARGVQTPTLSAMARKGLYATAVRDALPSVTYPNHTTLVTGVWPATHRIASNETFDPLHKNMGGWYWYAPDIKASTLWQAVHAAGGRVASLGWPVTVDQPAIDDNIPEYWRAHDAEDAKLEHALTTPGLAEAIYEKAGVTLADMGDTTPDADTAKAKAAAAIYQLRTPTFFTLHLSSLDEEQHLHGPGSPEAHAALTRIDTDIAEVVAAARAAEPDLVVMVVSDHGFAPVEHDVNLVPAFVQAGLMTLDPAGKVIAWDAAPWASGGSAGVVLARRDDPALKARVDALMAKLVADPASGVGRVIGRDEIARMGGAPDMDDFIDAKIGYEFGPKTTGPLVTTPGFYKGMHGYFPDHPEMHATLIIDGPALPRRGALGEVDMRAIAPTAAKLLGVGFTSAEARPLF
jgi:predicted AlkP superfamily pyrophosphatase or phosphodiesterase